MIIMIIMIMTNTIDKVSAFDADDAPVGCPINATDAEGLECANLEPRSLATQNYEAILTNK